MTLLAMVAGTAFLLATPAPGRCVSQALSAKGGRLDQRGFKGVELYSWTAADGTPRFSLLWGTNRRKTEKEIKRPACTLPDVRAVERALSRLAKGEWVTWVDTAPDARLAYPSKDVVRALRAHARKSGITLEVPPETPRL